MILEFESINKWGRPEAAPPRLLFTAERIRQFLENVVDILPDRLKILAGNPTGNNSEYDVADTEFHGRLG